MPLRLPLRSPYLLGTALALPLLAYVLVVILGPTGMGRVGALEAAIAEEEKRIRSLQERNQLMAAEIARLQDGPGQVERLARNHFGMIMPGEVFIQEPPRR